MPAGTHSLARQGAHNARTCLRLLLTTTDGAIFFLSGIKVFLGEAINSDHFCHAAGLSAIFLPRQTASFRAAPYRKPIPRIPHTGIR